MPRERLVPRLAPRSERHPLSRDRERPRGSPRREPIGIRQPGVAEREGAARLVLQVGEGHELPRSKVLRELAIQLGQRLFDRPSRRDQRKHRLDRRHDETRAHSLSGDVGDDDSDGAVGQAEDVVEISGDEVRRHVARRDAPAVALHLRRRQKTLLDLAGELELFLSELALLHALDALAQPVLHQAERVKDEPHDDRRGARRQEDQRGKRSEGRERDERRRHRDHGRGREPEQAAHEVDGGVDQASPPGSVALEPATERSGEKVTPRVDEEAAQAAVGEDAQAPLEGHAERRQVGDRDADEERDHRPAAEPRGTYDLDAGGRGGRGHRVERHATALRTARSREPSRSSPAIASRGNAAALSASSTPSSLVRRKRTS